MHLKFLPRTFSIAILMAVLGPFALSAGTAKAASRLAQDRSTSARTPVPANVPEVVTPSGLKYTDLRIGEGDEASSGKIVEVHYIGWLEDGIRFDSSRDHNRPLTFRLGAGDVLKGWDEGLAGMKVGGKRRLVIPPGLGFGKQGVGSVVPPNAVLYYEFELLGVR
jgi:FKBP-type peptidyl-prolyl cis-trans isomerase FkpA